MTDTNPENFRRDSGVPCPVCKIGQHSFESMQLHYKAHAEAEKRGAWEKTLQERRHVFALVPAKGYQQPIERSDRFTTNPPYGKENKE